MDDRSSAEARIEPDPARLAEGWERRFVVEGRRVREYVDLYDSLGFEVAADPVRREQVTGDCDDCRIALLLEFKTIYTRLRRPGPG